MTHRPPSAPSRRKLAAASRPSAIRRAALAALAFALAVVAPRASAALTLEDAIKLALQNNQRLKVSTFDPQIARARVLAEYGLFDPAITFRRSYGEDEAAGPLGPGLARSLTKTDDYSLSLDGVLPWGMSYSLGGTTVNRRGTATGFLDNYETFGGVSVTQPLLRGFGFGATLAGLRIAKASRGISDWQHRQTIIDTITNVILVYNNLQEARESLRIFTLSRDLAAQLLGENEKKLRVGATSESEVTQARARVANREEAILTSQRRVRDIENQLRLQIGESTFSVNGAPLEIAELPPAPDIAVNAGEDVKRAFEQRPDYQAARLGIAIDRASYSSALNALLPRVDFVGSYGYSGVDPNFRHARQQVRDEDARAYSMGVVVRVPLAFAEGRGRARAAKLTLRQSEADLVRLEQDIAIAIAAAAGQIETTKLRVAATRASIELAQQALTNEQKRFTAGTSTTFLVSQAQGELSNAQNSYARALADQRRAIANYERELGATLRTHAIAVE